MYFGVFRCAQGFLRFFAISTVSLMAFIAFCVGGGERRDVGFWIFMRGQGIMGNRECFLIRYVI